MLLLLHAALIIGYSSVLLEGAENDIERKDTRRPIWDMGNMVNSIQQIQDFVTLGANSIGTDITFDKNAKPEYTFHGVPCDCFRNCRNWEPIDHFLAGLRNATTKGDPKYKKRLILVLFNLKTKGLNHDEQAYEAGKNMAISLLRNYWNNGEGNPRAKIVLSVPVLKHYKLFNGFMDTMKSEGHGKLLNKVGFDFSGNDDIGDIKEAYNRAGITDRIWQGDGISNCLSRSFNRLKDIINERDSEGLFQKIYFWSVDKHSTIRAALDAGVDCLVTNYPDAVVSVLKEDAYKDRFRLADVDDDPWTKYTP